MSSIEEPNVARLAAVLYQACGAYDMPERVLDLLSAAANGEPYEHLLGGILPVEPPAAPGVVAKSMTKAAVEARVTAAILDLTDISASDALSIATGVFVSLVLNVVRSSGHDISGEVKVDGGQNRDITIGAPKNQMEKAAA